MPRRPTEPKRELRREVEIRDSANAIRAEQPGQTAPNYLVRMVSVTRVGCTVWAVVPAGVRTTCPGAIPESAGTGPATTMLMDGGSNSATKPLPTPDACTATTGNARLPVSGAIETVTVAWAALTSDVPSAGSRSATWKVLSAPSPLTS